VTKAEWQEYFRRVRNEGPPWKLIIINEHAERLEVPGTEYAIDPVWSPDGTVIAFRTSRWGSDALWRLRVQDLSVQRVSEHMVLTDLVLHPSGVLYYKDIDYGDRSHTPARDLRGTWERVLLSDGEAIKV
jgi:hypothetical protein